MGRKSFWSIYNVRRSSGCKWYIDAVSVVGVCNFWVLCFDSPIINFHWRIASNQFSMTVNKTELWRRKVALWIVVGFVTIVSLFFLFGCNATKTTSEKSLEQKDITEAEQNDKVKLESQSNVNIDTNVKDNSTNDVKTETNGESETNITNRKFSPPDLNGVQHVTEETIINTKKADTTKSEANQKNDITSKAKLDAENKLKLEAELKAKEEAEAEANLVSNDTTKSKPPAWGTEFIVIMSFGILVLLYFILKRFKVIG